MQSAKKRVVALSALSMAAAATLGAKSAQGVTFGYYYDNASILSSSDAYGQYQANPVTSFGTGASSTLPATVTLNVGQVLEFGMDAAVTGDVAASHGNTSGGAGLKVPANIGASALSIQINSTDATGALLKPVDAGVANGSAANNTSTAYINDNGNNATFNAGYAKGAGGFQNGSNTVGQGNNTTAAYIPYWNSVVQSGAITGGAVGPNSNQTIAAGSKLLNTNGVMTSSSVGIESLGEFSATSQTIGQATDFFDSLQFSAKSAGTVTLSPFSQTGQDEYWSQTNTSTASSASLWQVQAFKPGTDTVLAIPQLVVVITGGATTTPLFSLTTAAPGATFGSQITNGTGALQGTFTGPGAAQNTLTVVGGSGFYTVAQATGIKDASGGANGPNQGFVAANGFTPATDKEIFALDVEVGGTQASANQLATLLADAQAIGGLGAGVSVTTVGPSPTPFGSQYNFFVEANPGVGASDFLGFDLLSTNDSNLAGYTVSAVAVVPEPMSLGLLALGGVGLMARRNRRKA